MDYLEVFGFTNKEWINILIAVLMPLALALGLHYLLFIVLKNALRRTEKLTFRRITGKLKVPSLFLFLGIALKTSSWLLGPNDAATRYIEHLLNIFFIFSIAWLMTRFVGFGKTLVLSRYDFNSEDNLDARRVYTQFKIVERIINFLIIILAISLALMTFDSIRKLGISLLASAGVAGIIIGFAAQKLLATILAGLQIAITQPISLDDVVIIENEWGWIEEITLTYIVVRIWDKRRLVVPTTYFIEKPFQNWTRTSADILGTVFIYADFTLPIDEVRKELTKILEKDSNWDGKVNVLQVTNATEKTVEIRALMSASDSPSAWDLRVNVREKLIEFLQRNYPESLPKSRVLLDK
jgi:small-conductance mechanosensitive channel